MRIWIAVGVVALVAATSAAASQDNLAGFRTVNIPGWTVFVQQDPFTDAWKMGSAFVDGVAVLCDPARGETNPAGLKVMVTNLPALNVDMAEVEYRIGRNRPQTGMWPATTGTRGSIVTAPTSLVADVLRAGQLAVRVQGQHTRLLEWVNGDVVYELLSECAGWE